MTLVPNMYAEVYQGNDSSCRAIPNAGSIAAVANLLNCNSMPPEYKLSFGAVTTDSTSVDLTLSEVDGVAAGASDLVYLSAGTLLYSRTAPGDTAVPLLVTEDTEVGNAATPVPCDPPEAAIDALDEALTWALLRIDAWQDVSINDADGTSDTSDGATIFDSQGAVSKGRSIPLRYRITKHSAAHRKVLHPCTRSLAKEFFMAVKHNAYPVLAGVAIGLNPNRGGANKGQAEKNLNVSYQSDQYFPDYLSEMEAGSAEETLYRNVMELCGFPIA